MESIRENALQIQGICNIIISITIPLCFKVLLMTGIDSLLLTTVITQSKPNVEFFCLHSLSQTLNPSNFNMPDDKGLPLSDVQLPLVILWDEAYTLPNYLMWWFTGTQHSEVKRIFNSCLSKSREAVQNASRTPIGKWIILKPNETSLNMVDKSDKWLCFATHSY